MSLGSWAICKVETTKNIVIGLVDFYNRVFYNVAL